jgi:hypothetical protein
MNRSQPVGTQYERADVLRYCTTKNTQPRAPSHLFNSFLEFS